MGRPRKHNPLGLPPRCYMHHGAFFYVHPSGEWERLGTEVEEAKRKAKAYNDPNHTFGTMAHYLDEFIKYCDKQVALREKFGKEKGLAPRTRDDYKTDAVLLKKYFGKMTPVQVTPKAVQGYLDLGAELGRPTRANRERAALSACLSWLIRTDDNCGIRTNPCVKSAGVKRNRETKRDVYVEDAWFNAVYERASKSVRGMMMLIYRTLQRPEDVLNWNTRENLVHKDGVKILRNDQGKTGTIVDIEINAEIETVLRELQGAVPSISQPWIRRLDGDPYTYDGLDTIFRRVQTKVRKEVPELRTMPTWGFQDCKGKGATDMWQSGVPIETIQHLCGHKDKATTEIYVKCRWRETATANQVKIGA